MVGAATPFVSGAISKTFNMPAETTVEEIGGTTVFLCSVAAAQITGTTIAVDGGWTAH